MSSYSYSPAKIALTATGVISTCFVAYAVYFDYKRRNDPIFRKKLMKDHKKVEQKVKQGEQVGRQQVVAALKRALALVNSEPVPQDVEGREQFFMEQVAMGEQLAARSPDFYVASAISFYKALKVYPAPQELIMIYQKTQPAAVFDLVMELISLEMSSSQSASSSDPRDRPSGSGDALLEEIEDSTTAPSSSSSSSTPAAPHPAAPTSEAGSGSSPSNGSFVVVDDVVEDKEKSTTTAEKGELSDEAIQAEKEAEEKRERELRGGEGSDPPEPVLV